MTAVTAAPRGHQNPPLPDADLAAVLRYINDHDQGKGVDMSGGAGHPAVTPLRRARALSQLRDRGFIYKPSASPYNIKVRLTPQGRDWLDQYDQLQPERKEAMATNSGATRAPFNKHAQPWWEQYQGFQAQHDDAIVLLQMGANYEAYGTQAAVLASVARQAIKTRPIAVGKHVEMALVARPQLRATCEVLAAQGHPVVVVEASLGQNGTERKVTQVFEPTTSHAEAAPETAVPASDVVVAPEVTTGDVPGESQPEAAPVVMPTAFPAFDKTRITIGSGPTDDGAWDRCIMAARRLVQSGAWDGQTPIELHEPYFFCLHLDRLADADLVPGKKLPHGAGFTLEGQPAGDFAARANQIEVGDFVCNRALKQTRIVREIQDEGRTLLVRSDELKADSGLWGWDASAVEVVIRMNSTAPEIEAPASEAKPDGWTDGEDLPVDLDPDEAAYTDADWETKVAAAERAVEAALDAAETGAAEAGMTPGELEAQVIAEMTGEITPLSAAPPSAVPQIISVAPVQLLAAETIAATEALLAATQRDNKALRTQHADLLEQVAGQAAKLRELHARLTEASQRLEEQVTRGQQQTHTISRLRDRRARAQQHHRQIIRTLRAAALDIPIEEAGSWQTPAL